MGRSSHFSIADLRRRYEEYTAEELLSVVADRDGYDGEAVELAREVLTARGVVFDEAELVRAHRELVAADPGYRLGSDDGTLFIGLIQAVRDSLQALTPLHHDQYMIEYAEQSGLRFGIQVMPIDDDEFRLTAGPLEKVWYNIDEKEVTECLEIVLGLVTGSYRIVERYAFGRRVKVQLQRQMATGWETIDSTGSLLNLIPTRRVEHRILRNASAESNAV